MTGYKPFCPTYVSLEDNDCFRCSVAYLLDIHPEEVKFIDPCDYQEDSHQFWKDWYDYLLEEFGKKMIGWNGTEEWYMGSEYSDGINRDISYLLNNPVPWIAIVPTIPKPVKSWSHAIGMFGDKLFYESNTSYPRKRKPRKIFCGVTLEDA